MNQSGERRIVLSAPGFPVSDADHDKPFLLNHAKALSAAGFHVTVVCPALPNLAGRQTVEGIEVIRVRYAPRRVETLAVTGSMYEEAKGIRKVKDVTGNISDESSAYHTSNSAESQDSDEKKENREEELEQIFNMNEI